jgi:arylsulfatase A-like enzyme
MSARREWAARAALWTFCAATSLYCLLCFLSFAWTNLIADARYPHWIAVFVRDNGFFALAAAALGASALRGRARPTWGAAFGAAAAAAAATGWLAARGNNATSLVGAFAAWAPYFTWEAALTWTPETAPQDDGPRPDAALRAAAFTAIVYTAYALADRATAPGAAWNAAAAGAWSVLAHASLFILAALALDAARALPRGRELLLWLAAVSGLYWALGTIAFKGPVAWTYSAIFAASLARFVRPAEDGARSAAAAPWRRVFALTALAAFPWAERKALGGQDWNRLLETGGAVGVWLLAAAFFSGFPAPADQERARRRLWAAAALCAALTLAAVGAERRWSARLQLSEVDPAAAVRALESDDVSLATARRILRRSDASGNFYSFLQENTNLPRGGAGKELELVKNWPKSAVKPPHVFFIVVDSLRPDYLGAYDPKVRFTPAIDAFARDAVVFRKTFAAYGATGLSEPSIWTGARLPHEQYPQPFPPLNTLEKLIDRDGFRPIITVDVILTALLKPDKRDTALDRGSYLDYKFCRTVDELEGRLDGELATGRPLFVYTQPQDVHISAIQREGAKPVSESPAFDGFYAPYASRVARLDACFGRFVASLKARGIYDDSIIVLTADHGDSLGEDGRWGHAYTLFPEILRVPLLVRVPRRLLEGKYWNPDAAAFLTDLSPTLYALLGREPDAEGEPFGRPLFERDRATFLRRTRPERLSVSSYGPVYGLVRGDGEEFYLADGVNYSSYLFDLKSDPSGTRNLTDATADARGQAEIRRQVDALRRYYNY